MLSKKRTIIGAILDNNYPEFCNIVQEQPRFINQPDTCGNTPLFHAVSSGKMNFIEFLVENNARINPAYGQCSPLCLAAFKNRKDIVDYLLSKGADINQSDEIGNTPLHHSIKNELMLKYLIENNAEISAKNYYGQTPLFLAQLYKQKVSMDILIRNGAIV